MLRPFFPELVMSVDLLSLEHPSVLLFPFSHPRIKPKFPSRQNYPIYGMSWNVWSHHCGRFMFDTGIFFFNHKKSLEYEITFCCIIIYSDTLHQLDITLPYERVTKLELVTEFDLSIEFWSFHRSYVMGVAYRRKMLTPTDTYSCLILNLNIAQYLCHLGNCCTRFEKKVLRNIRYSKQQNLERLVAKIEYRSTCVCNAQLR